LNQQVTPWQGDDARRFGAADWEGRDRRGSGVLLQLVLLVLLIGVAFVCWYFRNEIVATARERQARAGGQAFALAGWKKLSDLDMVPRNAPGLLAVRVASLWESEGLRQFRALLGPGQDPTPEPLKSVGLGPDNIERVTVALLEVPNAAVPRQTPNFLAIVATRKPYDARRVMQVLTRGAAPEGQVPDRPATYVLKNNPDLRLSFPNDHALVVGPAQSLHNYLNRVPEPTEQGPQTFPLELTTQGHQVVASLVLPPELAQRLHQEIPPPLQAYRDALNPRSAILTVDSGDVVRLDLRLDYGDAGLARRANQEMLAVVRQARQQLDAFRQELAQPQVRTAVAGQTVQVTLAVGLAAARMIPPLGVLPLLEPRPLVPGPAPKELPPGNARRAQELDLAASALKEVAVQEEGTKVHVSCSLKPSTLAIASALLLPSVQKVRQAATRTEGMNNLKQIGLAMHMYADQDHGIFPPPSFGGGLSWRVALLPHLGHKDLYDQFKLNEPWDSPHNKQLLAKMPPVYASPTRPAGEPGSTFYQVFVGPGAAFERNHGVRIPEFTDGLSNTLLVVEAAQAVPWTKPADLPFALKGQLPRLGAPGAPSFLGLLADGSVRPFPQNLTQESLRGLITRSGGEPPEQYQEVPAVPNPQGQIPAPGRARPRLPPKGPGPF
jgi:hypothetical protein